MFSLDARHLVATLREASKQLGRRARAELQGAADLAKQTAAARAPGRIGRTLSVRRRSREHLTLGSSWSKVGLLEFGTKPHRIEPVRGRMLAFPVNGSMVFARGVDHPGNRAYRFMARGRMVAERRLTGFLAGPLF